MKNKKNIGIIIYANPDHYPPVINAIHILKEEFDLVVICRNQGEPELIYGDRVKLYRLGNLKSVREKEAQNQVAKFFEYVIFSILAVFYISLNRCRLIYSYDAHGLITGFFASRFGKKIPLIYHNLDLYEIGKIRDFGSIIKHLELRLAPLADKIVFPDINRARYFQKEAKLPKFPAVVMNTPLLKRDLPDNILKEILEAKGCNPEIKAILYQGAVNEEHALLEIVKSMTSWPRETVLVIFGMEFIAFKHKINQEVQALNLEQRIFFLPFIPYMQIFSRTVGAYLGLALFKPRDLNQTFVAGASNKIFEYICMGVPVVTNDLPYFREVLDSSFSYFVRSNSPEDIAQAINLVISNEEEHHKKSRAARDAHLTYLNFETQFNPIFEYIKNATKE